MARRLPVVVRTTEDMLSLIPTAMREAAVALGAPKWKMIVLICYRAAKEGIVTGILLALARVAGETAPLLFTSLSRKERRERARTALRVVGLEGREDHFPRQLSGGQEQRVAIARAIVTDPYLLVADEPTGDLDRVSAEEILLLLEQLNHEFEKTIVMVTHDPQAAKRATRLLHLDKGKLVADVAQGRDVRTAVQPENAS